MGYRSRNRVYRPRPAKKKVKLEFGVVDKKGTSSSTQEAQVPEPPAPMERQKIIGSLYVKKVDFKKSEPLEREFLLRILENLQMIFENGKVSKSKRIVDFLDKELLISFPFNQELVDRIKGLDRNERAWDAENKHWRVFPGAFDDVLDILGKGVTLTPKAYAALVSVVKSKYYAYYGREKLGKLIVRESWFEEVDLDPVNVAYHSNAHLFEEEPPDLDPDFDLDKMESEIQEYDFKRKPFEHQLSGIRFLLANPEAALLDEMGCGKTFQIASSLGILFKNGSIDRALIVCPMSLVKTWGNEIAMALDEPYRPVIGTPIKRQQAIESGSRILVIHYEGLRLEEERLSQWMAGGQGAIVFDESQRVKNMEAKTSRSAREVRKFAQRCVIATGTPIANRPVDLFSQYLIMDKGRTFGTNFHTFKNSFCEMEVINIQTPRGVIKREKFVNIRRPDELRQRVLRTSLRRLKSEVIDLPPVLYKDYIVTLPAEQKSLYSRTLSDVRRRVNDLAANGNKMQALNMAFVELLRLSQAASNPLLVDPDYRGPNGKFREVESLLEDILGDDTKKVILWSHFSQNVKWLAREFDDLGYNPVIHIGDMNLNDRQKSIDAFKQDPETRLFIATPQSAKEGLTLLSEDGKTTVDTMIYFDLSFDSASYLQSQARFHRIGQTAEKCTVIHMLGEKCVDEKARLMITEKIAMAGSLLDDDVGDIAKQLGTSGTPSDMSLEKIQEMIGK